MFRRGRGSTPLLLGAIAAVSFVVVAGSFSAGGVNWLEDTDCSLFWRNSRDPAHYSRAVLPVYTTIIWLLSLLFQHARPAILMQSVSLVCYVGSALVAYQLLVRMGVSSALNGALLFALFPLTGVANAVMPRVDAMISLVCVALCFTYVTNRNVLLTALLALSTMVHYSMWPFVGVLVLVGLHERRLKLWMMPLIALPFVLYYLFGGLRNGDWAWPFARNAETFLAKSSLPILDGLIGSIAQGLTGATNKLARGLVLLVHFAVALFLLGTRVWRKNLFLLPTILTPVLFGILLNRAEVWSMRDYTAYLMIPLVVYLSDRRETWLRSSRVWVIVLMLSLLSQFIWAAYVIRVVRP